MSSLGISEYDVIVLLVILAFVAVAQFFRGRKINLLLIEYTVKVLEDVFRPSDKEYQWIGLYVGYRARFKVSYKSLLRIEAVVTLLPRHSLLYLPISYLTSRFDKIFIFFRYGRKFSGEAHLIRKHYYRLGYRKVIRGVENMIIEEVNIKGRTYYLIYNSLSYARLLLKTVEKLNMPHTLNHLAVVPSNNSVYVAAKVDPNSFTELIRGVYTLAREVA